MSRIQEMQLLDNIIKGRVKPYIYAFTTQTVPNYLKVGDTYRSVDTRLDEWRRFYPNLEKKFQEKATVDDDVYFRDYSVHEYLEKDLNKKRLDREKLDDKTYYSKEFFYQTSEIDIKNAIKDIKNNYNKNTGKYDYYNINDKKSQDFIYSRTEEWKIRPNQQEAVNNFKKAIENGRTNLLMYAVMRFGKSFTSLCCALKINAKFVLVLSAKADVKDEWKKTVESPTKFKDYIFLDTKKLKENNNYIQEEFDKGKKVVLFLTLQDLQGDEIKSKHINVFKQEVDLLIVDETHFGARADSFGKVLKNYDEKDEKNIKKLTDEFEELSDENQKQIKAIKAKVRLHLSGTPYRILMGNEFAKEDIISFVQFSDIVNEQRKWDEDNLNNDEKEDEWNNPYYGFPQMIRFAFNPNKSTLKKIEELKNKGIDVSLSKLFETQSINLDSKNNTHKKFIHEKEILDLLKIIDGSKQDENILSFLNYDKIKQGKMCRHMVMVLPYCASCDALEALIKDNKDKFKNLNNYEIINISGLTSQKLYKTPKDIKDKISQYEVKDKQTITLTVNRMLTGSTVKEWDTMIFLKDTSSPQEYDQAIFRLQNQYIRTLSHGIKSIKEVLKPQTLLVDFDPNRLFRMQEQKSLIYNVNIDKSGNSKLKERLEKELKISPIITINSNKIKEVQPIDILEVIGKYNDKRSIFDEVSDIPVDLSILKYEDIRKTIENQAEFGSKQGLEIKAYQGDEDEHEFDEANKQNDDESKNINNQENYTDIKTKNEQEQLVKKIQTYYQRILFFSFLSKDKVSSLEDILEVIDNTDNMRIAKNLNLEKEIIDSLKKYMNPFVVNNLDYKIQNISKLACDKNKTPLQRASTALSKFNRMSESEVITPAKVCDDMVAMFPKDGLKQIIQKKEKFLDIASKSAEYAVALYKKLEELGFKHEEIKDSVYSIPTSSIAYEFTRKFYEILGLNLDNIAIKFNSYDLIEIKNSKNELDYDKINSLLKQNKNFSEMSLDEDIKGDENKVKFGAVIGNPPYQISDNDSGNGSAKPIYNHFSKISLKLVPRYISLIIPSVWFTGGKGLDGFREYMLDIKGIKEIVNFITPQDIFPHVNLRGGVNYFLFDNKYDNSIGVRMKIIKNNLLISDQLRLKTINNVDVFIADNIAHCIIERMMERNHITANINSKKMLHFYISVRNPFGFDTKFTSSTEFINNKEALKEPIKLYASKGQIGYVENENIKKNREWINSWKVITPFANNIGTNLQDDNLNTTISEPKSIATETFLVIGADLKLDFYSCKNLEKYLKTKFVRFLISIAKANQNGTKITYRFVPMQDFTKKSDIDWSKSIDEIDEQLFRKYKLSKKEVEHIKSSIKDM